MLFTLVWLLYGIAAYNVALLLYFFVGDVVWFQSVKLSIDPLTLLTIVVTASLGLMIQLYAERLYGRPLFASQLSRPKMQAALMATIMIIAAAAVLGGIFWIALVALHL